MSSTSCRFARVFGRTCGVWPRLAAFAVADLPSVSSGQPWQCQLRTSIYLSMALMIDTNRPWQFTRLPCGNAPLCTKRMRSYDMGHRSSWVADLPSVAPKGGDSGCSCALHLRFTGDHWPGVCFETAPLSSNSYQI